MTELKLDMVMFSPMLFSVTQLPAYGIEEAKSEWVTKIEILFAIVPAKPVI